LGFRIAFTDQSDSPSVRHDGYAISPGNVFVLHSVQEIVAPWIRLGGILACRFLTGMLFFNQLKLYFNDCALIFLLNLHNLWRGKVKFSNEDPMQIFFKGFYNYFSKFLHVRNLAIKLNMPQNYGINIFYYEGPRSLTNTVAFLFFDFCGLSKLS